MTIVLQIALINALIVLPLAVIAHAVSRLARRPAITHVVWVLVLLKLVTPPLLVLPFVLPVPKTFEVLQEISRGSSNSDFTQVNSQSAGPGASRPSLSSQAINTVETARGATGEANSFTGSWFSRLTTRTTIVGLAFIQCLQRRGLQTSLAFVWIAGSVCWIGVQLMRAMRFQKRIQRDAIFSIDLQNQTQEIGAKLGLRRVPEVLVVDVALSPLLWGFSSSTKLLFPLDLMRRLNFEARATLLTHELAHYSRRDHWVRLLELFATGLFWWHPIVWWARQQIEESEEECCDAWVVSQFPHAPRQYAEALLDTIDFLCEEHQSLSPVATGLGQSHFLRLRLTKIMQGPSPKSLTPQARFVLALSAAALLPLQPFVLGSARTPEIRSVSVESFVAATPVAARPDDAASAPVEIPVVINSEPETPAPVTRPAPPTSFSKTSRLRSARGAKVWSTAASPDGRFVARATTARQLILTDRASNTEFDLSAQYVSSIAFVPDGESFVAAGTDGRVTVWDGSNGELQRTVLTQNEGLRSIAMSPTDGRVVVGGRDGIILLFELSTGRTVPNMPTFAAAVNCVRFSPDGRQIAVAIGDWSGESRGEVVLLNAADGQFVRKLDCASTPGAVSFASNEELIVGLWNGQAQLWNLTTEQVVGVAKTEKTVVAAAAFSQDNPALRELTFEAVMSNPLESRSPFSVIQNFLRMP